MEIWLPALLVFINIVFWSGLWCIEYFEARLGLIPARAEGRFRYFRDWNMVVWGDSVGLSVIDAAAGYVLLHVEVPSFLMVAAVIAGVIITGAFHCSRLLGSHVPDSGYPYPRKVSWLGLAHLLYFFLQSVIASFLVQLAISGYLTGWPFWISVAGGVIYLISFAIDWGKGKLS